MLSAYSGGLLYDGSILTIETKKYKIVGRNRDADYLDRFIKLLHALLLRDSHDSAIHSPHAVAHVYCPRMDLVTCSLASHNISASLELWPFASGVSILPKGTRYTPP